MSLIEGGALIPARSTFLRHFANRRRVRCNDLSRLNVRVLPLHFSFSSWSYSPLFRRCLARLTPEQSVAS